MLDAGLAVLDELPPVVAAPDEAGLLLVVTVVETPLVAVPLEETDVVVLVPLLGRPVDVPLPTK